LQPCISAVAWAAGAPVTLAVGAPAPTAFDFLRLGDRDDALRHALACARDVERHRAHLMKVPATPKTRAAGAREAAAFRPV
jgi:hypothetical protein